MGIDNHNNRTCPAEAVRNMRNALHESQNINIWVIYLLVNELFFTSMPQVVGISILYLETIKHNLTNFIF